MKKRSLLLKSIVIANALLVTAAFVGCPARNDSAIVPHIAPPPFVPAPIATPPLPPFVTIAPNGGNSQQFLPSDQTPPAANQDSKNDKRGPN